jgi:Transient receptor potential (TRP) ion channel
VYAGIRRVGYVASIEASNVFMTVYIAFALVVLAEVTAVLVLRTAFGALVRKGRIPSSVRLQECIRFTALILKGMLLRTVSPCQHTSSTDASSCGSLRPR